MALRTDDELGLGLRPDFIQGDARCDLGEHEFPVNEPEERQFGGDGDDALTAGAGRARSAAGA